MNSQHGSERPPPSAELASFVTELSFDTIPDAAINTTERCFLDTVGVALAGTTEGAGQRAIQLTATVSDGDVPLFGTEAHAGVTDAAFANATAAHTLDFDDDQFEITSHPSATMVPTVLTLAANRGGIDGRDAICAYVAGFETQYYLSQAITPSHYEHGWHGTSTFGVFGATTAAASLLGLEERSTRHALNIAASTPAGIYQNFGTMTKPMHAGQAARSGVTAALLAEQGFTADGEAIGGRHGFFELYAGNAGVDRDAFPVLGERWALVENGVYVKKYPCCYATHDAIEATREVRSRICPVPDPENIETVRVVVSPGAAEMLTYPDPTTGLEAKFSMEYCVASALISGRIDLETFTEDAITKPRRQAFRRCVEMIVDEDLPYTDTRATVEVVMTSGETVQKTHTATPGSPDHPLNEAELREKFDRCLDRLGRDNTVLFDTLRSLREADATTLAQVMREG